MRKSYKNYDWYKDYNFLINRKEVIDELVKLRGDEEVIEKMELEFDDNRYSDCYINSFLINVLRRENFFLYTSIWY
tara:strand:+ start:800 stop:1027 length:228 start_codon:yes stop_codon:yes gene_type:complete